MSLPKRELLIDFFENWVLMALEPLTELLICACCETDVAVFRRRCMVGLEAGEMLDN